MSEQSPTASGTAPTSIAPESPRARIGRGAIWGAVIGVVVALLIVRRHPHLHLHGGEVVLAFLLCIGLGAIAGAAVVRLKSRASDGAAGD